MLHFNQRSWFEFDPGNSESEVVSPGADVIHGSPISEIEKSTVPIPSTAKEYYLAKIANLVGEGAPIEEQLSKAVLPIIKKASVEFAPVDPEEYPNAPEGALFARYVLSEFDFARISYVERLMKSVHEGAPTTMVDGVVVDIIDRDPKFPSDGIELAYTNENSEMDFFTSMGSPRTSTLDSFFDGAIEPQPKTREEYYLAYSAGVLINDLEFIWWNKKIVPNYPKPKTPTEFYLAIQAGWVPTDAKASDEDPDLATHESENDGTN